MRDMRPGHAIPGHLSRRIRNYSRGTRSDRFVDELVAVTGLAPHGDEEVARLDAAGVILDPGNARIPALREDLAPCRICSKSLE